MLRYLNRQLKFWFKIGHVSFKSISFNLRTDYSINVCPRKYVAFSLLQNLCFFAKHSNIPPWYCPDLTCVWLWGNKTRPQSRSGVLIILSFCKNERNIKVELVLLLITSIRNQVIGILKTKTKHRALSYVSIWVNEKMYYQRFFTTVK